MTLSTALFSSGQGFASHFAQLFHPLSGEYDLIGNYPQARDTIRNIDGYAGIFDELRSAVAPELELIESRIIGPVRELQNIMKQIRKNITKRDHKVGGISLSFNMGLDLKLLVAHRLRPL